MTDAERLAYIRDHVVPWPREHDLRWLLAQLDAVLGVLRECSTFPCDTFADGTDHPNCRRCMAAETLGRLRP